MQNSTYENLSVNTFIESSMTAGSFNTNRDYLLEKEVAKEMNTYRNWGDFAMRIMPWEKGHEETVTENKKTIKKWVPDKSKYGNPTGYAKFFITDRGMLEMGAPGWNEAVGEIATKSLFSNTNGIWENEAFRIANNAPLMDSPELREKIRQRNDCSIKALVRDSQAGLMGRAIYNYADFMYCKHLGKISNNYLITLRRFSFPCSDYIMLTDPNNQDVNDLQDHAPSVGTMITWMGTPGNELDKILKYSVKMPFEEKTAEIQEQGGTGEGEGTINSLMNTLSGSYSSQVLAGTHGKSMQNFAFFGKDAAIAPYSGMLGHRDQNRVYGPVDVVKKTHIRGEKEGLVYEQNIDLVFDYELRSYDGINGKSAMLDLIANILAVCYSTGTWWGGARRSTGAGQQKAFTNLPLWKLGSGQYPMTFSGVSDCLMDTMSAGVDAFMANSKDGTVVSALKGIAQNIANMFGGAMLNKLGRPQKQAWNSLLTPEPTGFWHLTIGNPKMPIMMMGNLIMEKCEIQHYGPLGLDDFPTGIRVSVSLKPGKSRDISEIEQMYMYGDSRIYTPMSEAINLIYENSKPAWAARGGAAPVHTTLAEDLDRTKHQAKDAKNVKSDSWIYDVVPAMRSGLDKVNAMLTSREPVKLSDTAYNYARKHFGVTGDLKKTFQSAMEQDQGSNPKPQPKPKNQKATS